MPFLFKLFQLRLHGELCSECEMAEIPKSSKESSKNEVLKRSSTDPRDKNVPKQQRREDIPYQMLQGASGVDAYKGSGGCNDPSVETSPKEKSLKAAHKFDLNFNLPDLNETPPPESKSTEEVDKEFNIKHGSSFVAENLQEVVKVVRKLETEGHVSRDFRLKFLTWYCLKSTDKERDVVCAFIQTLNDDPSCLAGQLIDSFSDIINMRR